MEHKIVTRITMTIYVVLDGMTKVFAKNFHHGDTEGTEEDKKKASEGNTNLH